MCIITGTSEFFIALQDHPEWNNAFTVVGEVDDLTTLIQMTKMPVTYVGTGGYSAVALHIPS